MTSQFEYGIISEPEDAQRLGLILQKCFNSSPENNETYFKRTGLENFRIIRQGSQTVGGLAILQMGQWYGGECVPMAGIQAVGIAPEHRGSGAAVEMLRQTLKELYVQGVPISVLYPATQHLYRKVGYEQAGSFYTWEMPTQSIYLSDRSLPMQPVTLEHHQFHQLYHQQAKATNGYLNRNQPIWEQVVEPPSYAYLIGKNQAEGYIIFSQPREENSSLIFIRDLVLLTPAAVRRFWSFIADHRSQIEKVRWRDSAVESLTLILPEQKVKISHSFRWMLRIVNVVKALEKRGYPQELETELHLEVRDNLLPQNNGKFILTVSKGRGEVTKGGKGELQLDVDRLSPLYTGLLTPHQLQLTGQLQATDTALSVATQMFAGSSPWMPDFF